MPPKNKDLGKKTDSLSLRLDPATKWGLELMAREQRRAITGVVEWIIAEAFASELVTAKPDEKMSIEEIVHATWGAHELERLLGLWVTAPLLMTFEERKMMRVLLATDTFWAGAKAYANFEWHTVMPVWGELRPLLLKKSELGPNVGISQHELDNIGYLPF